VVSRMTEISLIDISRLRNGERDLRARDVRALLDYEPKTGVLLWKWRARKWFTTKRGWRTWNTRYAGKLAFNGGVRGRGRIFGGQLYRGRIIWFWMTGAWPTGEIDHEDHNTGNNCWSNLRDVTDQQNKQNLGLRANNEFGAFGMRRRRRGGFLVYIGVNGKQQRVGSFSTLVEAKQARKDAERRYGFHERHGT